MEHATTRTHWIWSRPGAALFGLLVLAFSASFAIPALSRSSQEEREADAKVMLRRLHVAQQCYRRERRHPELPGAFARKLSDLAVASLLPAELNMCDPDVGEFRGYLFEILPVSAKGASDRMLVTCSPRTAGGGRSFLIDEAGRILAPRLPASR